MLPHMDIKLQHGLYSNSFQNTNEYTRLVKQTKGMIKTPDCRGSSNHPMKTVG